MRSIALQLAVIGGLAFGTAAAQAPLEAAPGARPPPRTIRVTGEGRVDAAPDVVLVTMAATAFEPSLATATRNANEATRRLHDVLLSAGVAPADVQTVRYDVQVERVSDGKGQVPRIAGYRVTNASRVRIRDLAKAGSILDRAVAAGANQIEGLAFVRENTAPEESRALAMAVRAARAKAEDIARAANVRLGEVVEVSEIGGGMPGPIPLRAMTTAAEVPLQPGLIEVTSRVEVLYAIP